jgi:hypothetical protein
VLEVFYQEAANSRSGLTSAGRLRGDDRCSDDLYVFFSSSLLFFFYLCSPWSWFIDSWNVYHVTGLNF